MSKKLAFASLAAIPILATVVGIAAYEPVSAQGSRTAAVEVTHAAWDGDAYDTPVEPDTGESWTITVTWKYYGQPDKVETGSVDVDWNGSGWALSNQSTTTGILGFTVCADGECGTVMDPHGYGYKLLVQMQAPYRTVFWPDSAEFVVSSIDDGYTLTGDPCDTDESVSVISPYYFGATDNAPFDTDYDCDATGPSLNMLYE